MKRLLITLLLTFPIVTQAVDLEKGKKQARSCALCHGHYGQGTPGPASPRLAGTPAGYMVKQIEAYIKEERGHDDDPEDETFDELKDQDIEALLAYISSLEPSNKK
ncbi:MAG: c-type cytochrome [Candidatus Thiodiazotropha sp. (ex Ustalcina ferruginea)]|nr:c-type cytochrome [Candidatus Thiodiazotropha sp. (ex Ustalcina ferruginea)]